MMMTGRALGFVAAAVCVAAGVYLLQYKGAAVAGVAGGTSWFEIIARGMGIYFIGKGLFVARSTYLEAEQADRLRQLVELAAADRSTRNGDTSQ